MINDKIQNTAIINNAYDNRSFITHRFVTNNLAVATDGTLWAALVDDISHHQFSVYRSANNGFSWDQVFSENIQAENTSNMIATNRNNGAFISVNLFEQQNLLAIWVARYNTQESTVRADIFRYDLISDSLMMLEDAEFAMDLGDGPLAVKALNTEGRVHFLHINSTEGFEITTARPSLNISEISTNSIGTNYAPTFDGHVNKDGTIDVAVVEDNAKLDYYLYDGSSFNELNTVYNSTGWVSDVNVERNKQGDRAIAFADEGSPTQIHIYIRKNGETAWNGTQVATSTFTDEPTGDPAARVSLVAGLDNFIISYVQMVDGTAKTLVQEVDADLNLGQSHQIATEVTSTTTPVTGAKFFEAAASKYMDLSEPGYARVAYQGQVPQTSAPLRIGQELLSESAFKNRSEVETQPSTDTPGDFDTLATIKILPGPAENVDYYSEGLIGKTTKQYKRSFQHTGTNIRFFRYEPNPNAEMDNQSAYKAPEEFVTKAVITPLTYDTPFENQNENLTEFVERDVRKVYVPPDFHINRDLVLNDGNHLKRTVWTISFGGNEYEITQIVPSFVRGQIVQYSANAYVIGPSHDPFSRTVLPSET